MIRSMGLAAFYQTLYFIRTAFRGLWATRVTSGVAAATIGIVLVLVGAFLLLVYNMEDLLDKFGDDLRVTAYLEADLSIDAQRDLAVRVAALPGVAEVSRVSPEQALERFRTSVGSGVQLLEGLDANPLPASLEIVLTPDRRSAGGLAAVAESIEGFAGIDDLSSGRDWVEGYLRAVSLVRTIGLGLGVILGLATLLIVANTIRLGIISRSDELEILALVGASRGFVRVPFLLEGALQGGAGGAIALAILFALFELALPGLESGLEMVVGFAPRFFSTVESAMVVGGGAALGLIGSASAVTGGLRS
jgi:cell division transport system permease protein